MTELTELQEQLATAESRVASLEQALKDHPGYPSIEANLDSARRAKKRLETQLSQAAADLGIDLTTPNQLSPPHAPAS
ncbi:MAG TPA: hypothetical protein VFI31_08680 [Pirellulales bacterium]|nr:hypothetical protein [Pirellulales bacterium]